MRQPEKLVFEHFENYEAFLCFCHTNRPSTPVVHHENPVHALCLTARPSSLDVLEQIAGKNPFWTIHVIMLQSFGELVDSALNGFLADDRPLLYNCPT